MNVKTKNSVRFLGVLFCLAVMVVALFCAGNALEADAATYSGSCGSNVQWSMDTDNGVLTISGNGAMEDYFEVTAQPYQQYRTQIKKVVVEEGVVFIGRSAFYGFTNITEVVLPESLMAIEEYAFFGCTGITEMNIPAKVFYIGKFSLRKTGINTITFANKDNWAFTDGTTPDMNDNTALVAALRKTTATYEQTFMRTFEADGTVIASGEFGKGFAWTLTDTGVLNVTGEGDMPMFNVNTTPWYGYRGAIRTVVIGDGITSVGRCSFHTCRAIVSVTLPETIETIAEYAFYNMPYITSIKIPAAVTRIETFVLRKCVSLENIEMGIYYGWTVGGNKLAAVELYNATVDAFIKTYYNDIWERDVNAPFEDVNDPYFVAAGACNSYTSWKLVYLDEEKTQMKLTVSGNGKMPSYATAGAPWYGYFDSIVEIEVTEGVTNVGRCAFYDLISVTKVTLPEGLVSIDEYAFNGCKALTEIVIPSTVTTVAPTAFEKSGVTLEPKVYTVYFMKDTAVYATQEVTSGQFAEEPSAPSAPAGHTFGYWELDGEEFDFATPITSDITLVAKWNIKMFTLTFYGQDGVTVEAELEVPYGTTLGDADAPTDIPTTDGYKFNGRWYASKTGTSPASLTSKLYSDKSYYPGLIAPMDEIGGTWIGTDSKGSAYTVDIDAENQDVAITLVKGGVTDELDITVIYYNDATGKLVIRYIADGATSETILTLTYTDENTFTGSNSLVLVKEGTPSYTVSFDSNGGTAVEAQSVIEGTTATEPAAPTKEGFDFAGWTLNGAPYDFSTEVNGDITLVANWVEAAPPATVYTVTFMRNTTVFAIQEIVSGQCAEKPENPTAPSNYAFAYWELDGEEFDFATPITGDITLTAKYKGKDVTLKFYYDRNDCGTSSTKFIEVLVEYGTVLDPAKIPYSSIVMKDNEVFTGAWHKSSSYSAAPLDLTQPISFTTTQKLYPGFVDKSVTALEGVWNGTGSGKEYTFTIEVDDNFNVTATVVIVENGVATTFTAETIQFDGTNFVFKYLKTPTATSYTTLTIKYNSAGEVKLSSPSAVLTKQA